MRRLLFLTCLALGAKSLSAQPDSAFYLQQAGIALNNGYQYQALAVSKREGFFGPNSIAAQAAFQESREDMNYVLDAQHVAAVQRSQFRHLLGLAGRAAHAKIAEDRRRLFNELLAESQPYARAHPEATQIWIVRAAAALALGQAGPGREAGERLSTLGPADLAHPPVQKLLALLAQKGWLAPAPPAR